MAACQSDPAQRRRRERRDRDGTDLQQIRRRSHPPGWGQYRIVIVCGPTPGVPDMERAKAFVKALMIGGCAVQLATMGVVLRLAANTKWSPIPSLTGVALTVWSLTISTRERRRERAGAETE